MLDVSQGRRTQVVKGEVCKTSMQRFESARRLHFSLFPPFPAVFTVSSSEFPKP